MEALTTDSAEKLIASGLVIAGAILVRFVVARRVRSYRRAAAEDARRWLVHIRNLTVILVIVGLAVIWAEELRTAALSLVAVAAALVLAGKELIMAISGSFARATSGSFTVGDRVRIGEYRGDVIDHSLLVTTLLEIGPGHVRTGQTLVLPNSMLLTSAIANETQGHNYVLHSFTVPVAMADWQLAHDVLLAAAQDASAGYVDRARAHMEERAHEHALTLPIVDPFVLAKPLTPETVELTVRVPVPAREAWRIEHEVLEAWLQRRGGESEAPATSAAEPTSN